MKKAFAIVALIAAMFVAGNVQAQSMIYAGYAPETFAQTVGSSTSSTNYQGFCVGFTQNFGLSKGIGVAAGADIRMNTRSGQSSIWIFQGSVKETQVLIDVPILFNYGININRDLSITPFVGPMVSLALVGQTKGSDTLFGENTRNWYGDNSTWSRFNLHAVFGADLKFSQFNLFGGYRLGLLDLDSNDNITLKTNGFFIGLGYTL
jgi:hypothetical protein